MTDSTLLAENIRIVLVSPLYGGNIGSVCRAMMNGGLTDLRLVAPRPDTDWNEAERLAFRAGTVLQNRREHATLEEAVADCSFVAGTSARTGFYRDQSLTPRTLAPALLESVHKGNLAALVFGPEDCGLSNDDLKVCTHIIQIPSSERYRSLNLSHAVMVCVYELFCAADLFEPSEEKSDEVNIQFRERLFAAWEQMMLRTGFTQPEKLEHMMLGLRRIFSRGQLTEADAKILMGLARQTLWMTDQLENATTSTPLE